MQYQILDADMDEEIFFNLGDKEPDPIIKTIEQKSKKIVKDKSLNFLGLTKDETETVIAVIIGTLFLISLTGTLCGYSYWYINIR